MTDEYARLSLQTGMVCGRADAYLGRSHFGARARRVAWDLTPELLDRWRRDARAMGIPEDVIAGTEADTAETEPLVEAARHLQSHVDRRSAD